MALSQSQIAQLAIFKTKPLGGDGNFVIGWQQFFQSVVEQQQNAPKAYSLTHAARVALIGSNLTLGSTAFETDTNHWFIWNGKAWNQFV